MPTLTPRYATVAGLRVRYADSTDNAASTDSTANTASTADGPDAILIAPWPESIYAYEQMWEDLSGHARLIAVDLPGYGGSELSEPLLSPRAMGGFILQAVKAFGLTRPHLVGPDIGTSSALFAATQEPNAFRSIVVGSGGAAVAVKVTGILKSWVEEPDPGRYRDADPATIVDAALSTIRGFTASKQVRNDYVTSYADGRFAASLNFVQRYSQQLPELAELLPSITAPVRIVQGEEDAVVPAENAYFLRERIPGAEVHLIEGAGHFCWEEKPREYARLITSWWDAH